MHADEIEAFVLRLSRCRSTATLHNPYTAAALRDNLTLYLQHMAQQRGERVLLVGEAPGHAGCRLTGIPFTCGAVIEDSAHPLMRRLRGQVVVQETRNETSARAVWDGLEALKITPLLWNAVPFHPHLRGRPESNRKPNAAELRAGLEHLQAVIQMHRPDRCIGVGRCGEQALKEVCTGRDIVYVRHPARGGQARFLAGLRAVFDSR